jgi:hypothetical protein
VLAGSAPPWFLKPRVCTFDIRFMAVLYLMDSSHISSIIPASSFRRFYTISVRTCSRKAVKASRTPSVEIVFTWWIVMLLLSVYPCRRDSYYTSLQTVYSSVSMVIACSISRSSEKWLMKRLAGRGALVGIRACLSKF